MQRVCLKFLGRFELEPSAGRDERLNGVKNVLLLAWLAMPPGKTHDRKRLSETLWPDRGEAQALASLRQALWSLRRAMGEGEPSPILAERSSIRLDPDAVTVDTADFERLVRGGSQAELERAAALYRGDFLSEFDLDGDDQAPFLFERRRLREMALGCFRSLIAMRAAAGDADGAVEVAQRALSLDPLQEEVHAAIIRLHRDRGRLGLAREQYDACRDVLQRELGIMPSAEIEQLRASFGATAGPAPAPKPDVPRPPLAPLAIPAVESLAPRAKPRLAVWGWAAAAVAAVAVLYLFQAARSDKAIAVLPAVQDERPSLAVLPFEDVSADHQQQAVATGLTDDLIADLSKVSELFVIAPQAGTAADPGASAWQVARDMGVDYALKGTVQQSRGTFSITAQLVRTATGQAVWAERYDRQASDVFDVHDEVIRRIASSLKIELTERERRRITRIPTRSLEAHDFYQRAEHQNAGMPEPAAYRRSLAAYRRAIELDPEFAEAYAGYARLVVAIWRGDLNEIMLSAVARQEAYAAAGKALELDPENARAHEVLSVIQAVEGEHQIAIESARTAVDLQPGEPESHTNLAGVLYLAGDLEGAAAEIAVARRLSPTVSPDLRLVAATVAFAQGHYDEAVAEFSAIRELVPRSELVLEHMAAAYAYLGDGEHTREIVAELKDIVPIANLGFYSVLRQNIGTPEQTARLIEGLRRAGIPQWPFGDQRNPADRIGNAELRTITGGPVWTGKLENGVDFVQYFDPAGGFAYRSTTSLLTGHVVIQGDQLCQVIEGYLLNRPTCGYVYRNAQAGSRHSGDFVYVSIDAVKYFSVSQVVPVSLTPD